MPESVLPMNLQQDGEECEVNLVKAPEFRSKDQSLEQQAVLWNAHDATINRDGVLKKSYLEVERFIVFELKWRYIAYLSTWDHIFRLVSQRGGFEELKTYNSRKSAPFAF